MKHPFAWVDGLASEGVDFRRVAPEPEAWAEALPGTDALGLSWSAEDARADAALRKGVVPVLEGPPRPDVFGGRSDRSLILARPGDPPGRVWVALHRRYPAALWIPVEDAGAFRRVLETYFRSEAVPPSAIARVSLGIVRDFTALEERLLDQNPFCEAWATAEPLAPDAGQATHRFALRSLHSHGLAEVLQYGALAIGTLRYAPADDAPTIAACNGVHRRDLPADLPVDLAASLLELPVTTGPTVRRSLAAGGPADLRVLALITLELVNADLDAADLAGHAADPDPELRRAVITVAGRRGFRDLLAERHAHEPLPALRDQIRSLLGGS